MRDFIVNKAPWFALCWLGSVIAGTGLGALAISLGTPPMVVVYTELALQLALVLTVAAGVPDVFGGFVAMALTTVLPFGAFVAWAEVKLSSATSSAVVVVALGAVIVCSASWRSFAARPHLPRKARATMSAVHVLKTESP
ncbi:MAG TPA: hypothetical protein VGP93_09230 [Polyangiaceae bacterium]|jgi:hypothetical protein|nr:hypothetical protein [Polyangiaceae bacterium]